MPCGVTTDPPPFGWEVSFEGPFYARSVEPFCTAVSGPAAYRRSLCSQGSAAAPRRQLFLAQVAKMCMSYACNRFLPGDAAGDGLKLQLISAHPTCGHCLFEWGWELAALQRSASSDSALLSTLRWQCRCRTIYAFRVALTRAWQGRLKSDRCQTVQQGEPC